MESSKELAANFYLKQKVNLHFEAQFAWDQNKKMLIAFYNYYHYYLFSFESFFYTSINWLFHIWVWVTTSLLKFPGLFSLFWPISIMQQFGWSPFVLLFSSPLVLVLILWWLYREHQLQLVLSSVSCSTAFSIPKQGWAIYPSFHILSILLCGPPGQQSAQFCKFSTHW